MDETALARELGAINENLKNLNGKVDAQGKTMTRMDDRLRTVERKSAVNGGVAGGIMAVGIALIKDSLKNLS